MNGFKFKSPLATTRFQNRKTNLRFLLMTGIVLSVTLPLAVAPAVADQEMAKENLPDHWRSDAELTDVFFLNDQLGWAVGAQGVILRTTNAGENWKEIAQAKTSVSDQLSLDQKYRNLRNGIRTRSTGMANDDSADRPIRCRFESVHFVDPLHGWVAGGYEVPYVNRSCAVILRTNDGGITWTNVEGLVIPRISRIRFSDPHHGWAIGESSNLFQSGVFFTSNGGQSWSSQAAEKTNGWMDAAPTKNGFATINDQGRLGTFNSNQYESSVLIGAEHASVSQLRMIDRQSGWAVGEQGAVLKTANGGLSWSPVNIPDVTFSQLVKQFDLKTLAITPNKIWFAGDPGTRLFSIDRTTGKATSSPTPLSTRINQIHFVDDQHGWLVGSLGMILATHDGGQTWKIQRGENRRIAMLCVAPNYQSQPFEILAKYAGEENRICASMVLEGSRRQHQSSIQSTERLGSVDSILIAPHQTSVGPITEAPEVVLGKIVRVLRSLRPNVVVYHGQQTGDTLHATRSSNASLLVQKAIRMAADPSEYPKQITELGLKAWQVDRLAIRDPTGTVTLNPQQLLTRTGSLIEDVTALSRAIIGQSIVTKERPIYRVSHFTTYTHMKAGDLLSGLDLQTAIPTRKSKHLMHTNLTMLQEVTAKRKRFEQFESFEANNPHDLSIWNQQILSFALKLDSQIAGIWLMQLAEHYLESGKTELAANANNLLVTRWPNHALAPAAMTWLVQYYASDEFGQIEFATRVRYQKLTHQTNQVKRIQTKSSFSLTPRAIERDGVSHLVWLPTQLDHESESEASGVQLASATDSLHHQRPPFFDQRLRLAGRYLSQLRQRDPDLAAGPAYRLLEAQITRRINGSIRNQSQFKNLAKLPEAGISIAARRELRLSEKQNPATPIHDLTCHFTPTRPTLDGKLDEPFWQTAMQQNRAIRFRDQTAKRLTNDIANTNLSDQIPDIAVVAYDDKFFYAGFVCQKIAGQYYNTRKQSRPRDADLSHRDRIELKLDIDRDYCSSFWFAVDHRGWVREGCGGSLGWNPDWYVSQSETATTWTVEFAIPLDQLIPNQIDSESMWAIQMSRHAFSDQDVWSSGDQAQLPIMTGLRSGLETRPGLFELMQFSVESTIAESAITESVPAESAELDPIESDSTIHAPIR